MITTAARDMFEGFETVDVEVDGEVGGEVGGEGGGGSEAVRIHARVGGDGPPLLLLHGYPQTHVMWHTVAPGLAERFTVVAADLRGYGDSARPPSGPDPTDHTTYSKRATAADQVALMTALGHERFAVVGHDRGARVTHRLCLDHAERVTRAAVIDIVPTRHAFADVDKTLALAYEHWFFLAQENDLPETLIGGAPEHYLRTKLSQWAADGAAFDEDAVAAYVRGFDPESVHATTEDYRAGATVDLQHDEVDALAGRRIGCPLLVLWGSRALVGNRYDVLDVWRRYADDVRGQGIDAGHFVPEEAPGVTLAALLAFLEVGR